MLTIIFGAGASYDSLDDFRPEINNLEDRPPLADELFERRDILEDCVSAYPEGLAVFPRLRRLRDGVSLEEELDLIASEAEHDNRRYVQLNAIRYYIREAIKTCQVKWLGRTRGVTNYVGLLDQVWGWQQLSKVPVRLVTFNYDTMLDDACELAIPNLRFPNVESYASREDIRLYRPHGAISWSRVLNNLTRSLPTGSEREIINLGKTIVLTPDFVKMVGTTKHDDGRVLLPAIAIPLRRKSDFEMPLEHVSRLREEFAKTSMLLVIGWRATDEPFFKLMEDIDKRVPVVVVAGSGDGCDEIYRNLTRALDLAPKFYEPFGHGFSDFVHRRGLERLTGQAQT